MIQPSRVCRVSSVIFGKVLPYCSWPALPIGSSCHSMVKPVLAAAALITLTDSGTTSRPMSSPSNIPIFNFSFPSLIHLDAGIGDIAAPGFHFVAEPCPRVVDRLVDRRGHAALLEDRLQLWRLRRFGKCVVELVDDVAGNAGGRERRRPLRGAKAGEAQLRERRYLRPGRQPCVGRDRQRPHLSRF